MKIGPTKQRGHPVDPVTARMVRNLVWMTDFNQKKIVKIMNSIGRNITSPTVTKIMKQDEHYRSPQSGKTERAKKKKELTEYFKKMPVGERVKSWTTLNDALQTLKKTHAVEKDPAARELLHEKMSTIFELLEALVPLISEAARKADYAKTLKAFEKIDRIVNKQR